MIFREALEREIAAQGISVTEIAQISGVSKGAIYNILNGKTDEARIRPATKRAIARGCSRELEILGDGSVRLVEVGGAAFADRPADVVLRLVPDRPFLDGRFFREPFDWLHDLEEKGALGGIRTVDRVFQRREEFLSLVMENTGRLPVAEVRFDMRVTFAQGGPAGRFRLRSAAQVPTGEFVEGSLFLAAGAPYSLELISPAVTDSEGEARGVDGDLRYIHKG